MIIGGFGGQGAILAGAILGKAAVGDGKKVVQTQSYGAEARGGAARSEIIICDENIDYPNVIRADALIAMSQQAYDQYIDNVKTEGTVIVDQDLVQKIERKDVKVTKIPATKIASETLKLPNAANMIMVGVLTALTGIVTRRSLEESIKFYVPKGTEAPNLEAFDTGFKLAKSTKKG